MLGEGRRRASRGTDVVVAFMEDYGRPLTRQMAEGLETVPRRTMPYRGTAFTEMDLDAILARRPQVALVDELAHTNVPGCRNRKQTAAPTAATAPASRWPSAATATTTTTSSRATLVLAMLSRNGSSTALSSTGAAASASREDGPRRAGYGRMVHLLLPGVARAGLNAVPAGPSLTTSWRPVPSPGSARPTAGRGRPGPRYVSNPSMTVDRASTLRQGSGIGSRGRARLDVPEMLRMVLSACGY
nr:hypothetical protein [Streptomyces sp. TLI_235]